MINEFREKKYKYKTTSDFLKEAVLIHGDRYDYSLVKYNNAKTKIKIICRVHGEFEQLPRFHLKGQNCTKCCGLFMDTEYFKEKSKRTHGDKYDYSLVEYSNNLTRVTILCKVHGKFEQKPKDHLLGKGCSKCAGKNMNTEDFIFKATLIHHDKYNYSLTEYVKASIKIKIICRTHGMYEQTPNSHLMKRGCPVCKESQGEKIIMDYLMSEEIKFYPQYRFNDCINIKPLPFDFYLPEHNTCIEYQGEQHYQPIKFFGGIKKFKKQQINDIIKQNYCSLNNINLIIINNKKPLNLLLKRTILL